MYYEPHELLGFENIECEWPLFFCYLILDGLFTGRKAQVTEFRKALEEVVVKDEDGMKLVPELYCIPVEQVCSR